MLILLYGSIAVGIVALVLLHGAGRTARTADESPLPLWRPAASLATSVLVGALVGSPFFAPPGLGGLAAGVAAVLTLPLAITAGWLWPAWWALLPLAVAADIGVFGGLQLMFTIFSSAYPPYYYDAGMFLLLLWPALTLLVPLVAALGIAAGRRRRSDMHRAVAA